MRIRTITAPHMADALKIIREQLGPEALILSTRKVTGAHGQPTLEITAAVEDPPPASIPLAAAAALAPRRITGSTPARPQPAAAASPLAAALAAHGVPADLCARIAATLPGLTGGGFADDDALEMLLGKLLRFGNSTEVIARGQAHALIGPSGAGKTTLVAKLAIHARRQQLRVGLMSLDDQKIAGFEPLRVAAEALGETAHLIRTPADLAAASASLGPRHLILIDTPGLNPYQRPQLNAFKARLESLRIPLTCHLVLPATHNPAELALLPLAFAPLHPASLLFSRLDETAHLGGVAAAAHSHNLPLGPASHSPDFATAPLTLTARWLAEALSRLPHQPWELPDDNLA